MTGVTSGAGNLSLDDFNLGTGKPWFSSFHLNSNPLKTFFFHSKIEKLKLPNRTNHNTNPSCKTANF
jgi:hypothetical protein